MSDDAQRLKQLYESRVPLGMSQSEFGATYGIGTKAMVWQYLTGYRPLNYEAAAKFAKGLRCTIADISPELARRLKVDILPVLGRVSVKAALALCIVLPPMFPQKAQAAFDISLTSIKSAAAKIHIALHRLVMIYRHLSFLRSQRRIDAAKAS